jgi:tetratricopeptide (TPR) repeat protein/serine/threonine protein kinase
MSDATPRTESLFWSALAISSPEERARYLDEACGADQQLRRRLEELLAAYPKVESFMEPAATGPAAAVADPPSGESPGIVIGPYKLVEQVGEGGMGSVWMAQQTEPIKRLVALKLIKAGMDSKQVIARFEAERQALALMDHPNIAKVLDGGETPPAYAGGSPRPYFVMDLVKGVPITRYCDEHRLTPRQRLELFVPVCQAVQHAHQKGIIHRDLKPSNVLVALCDGQPVPKVIDFGVAKAAGQQLTDKTLVTGFGNIVGTLEYMSPEQAEFNQLDIDTRSDIYSLGVVLYELLTGSPPFSHKEHEKVGLLEMLRVIREQEPTKPSAKLSTAEGLPTLAANRGMEPAKLTKQVRGELDWIVMKALEKDRSRRYETANAFALDVQRYLADEPVLACPPSAGYRLRKFVWRNKGWLAVTAGVCLALMVMAASIGWEVVRRAETRRAETARLATVEGQVRGSLYTARILVAENKLAAAREKLAQARAQLGNDGPALDDLAAEVEAGAATLDLFQRFLNLIDQAHQVETAPLVEARLMADGPHVGAAATAPLNQADRRPAAAVPFLLEALRCYGVLERDDWTGALEGGLLGKQQVEQIRRLVYEELLWLADDVHRRKQDYPSGQKLPPEAAARQALAYLGKAESAHQPTPALYGLRALCRNTLGDKAAAKADAQLAARTPPTMALDHFLRGQAANYTRRLDEGVQAFEAALQLEPTHYWSMMKLGYCLCDYGQRPEDFARAVTVFTGCILKRPDHAHAYYCRARAYGLLRRYEYAVADSSKAIELDPKHLRAWYVRGWAYDWLGQPDNALANFSKAIELNPTFPIVWYARGITYEKLGQPDKALTNFSKAIELNPKDAISWYSRGVVYNKLVQPERAVADLSKAIDLESNHPVVWYNRGLAYRELDQPDQALADFSRAIDMEPRFALAWYSRGAVYGKLGLLDKALADFSRAIELNPKDARAWYNRGLAYSELGQPDQALPDYSRAIELNPQLALAWSSRGKAYLRLGQADKTITDFSKVIELEPKNTKAWYDRGITHDQLGRPDKALADYSMVIKLDPKYAPVWHKRGTAYLKLGQPDKALPDYSKAIELDPTFPHPWFNRGVAHTQLGQPKKALADFSKVIDLASDNPRLLLAAYLQRGKSHSRLGHFEQARTDYQTALQHAPANALAHNVLAWLLATCPDAKVRDPVQAVALARKAMQLAPKEGAYWNTLGVAHYRAGDWKAAIAALGKSVELRQGGDAVDRFFLAMAHQKLGNPDEARKAYDQALQWLAKSQATLEKNKEFAAGLRFFQAEAEATLELKKQ